jgi:ribosomal protein L11 methyltransferase
MNTYDEYIFEGVGKDEQEMLGALLWELGFEGIEERENSMIAYASSGVISEENLRASLQGLTVSYKRNQIADRNWNTFWEEAFPPVRIGDFAGIRADFHPPFQGVKFDLVITPKMSFGTGHHATTSQVIELMQGVDFTGKCVLDMGAGTGILAILAEKMGAGDVWAIDNDPWCIENSNENIHRNDCNRIRVILSDKVPVTENFDIIIANITKNILLEMAGDFAAVIVPGGTLLLSGILPSDKPAIVEAFEASGFQERSSSARNEWAAIVFNKR